MDNFEFTSESHGQHNKNIFKNTIETGKKIIFNQTVLIKYI